MKSEKRGGEYSVKYGKRKGKQCYLRGQCKQQFVSADGRHTLREEQSAVSLYCLGLSCTAIANALFVLPSTILRRVRKHAKDKRKKPVPQGESVIELEETRHFLRSKKQKHGFGRLSADGVGKISFPACRIQGRHVLRRPPGSLCGASNSQFEKM